jgi:glyoxylase-like metal-dependent hydrolase (beta-lactamase superfamily II)
MPVSLLDPLLGHGQHVSLHRQELPDNIIAFRLRSRWTRLLGFEVSFFLLDDLLVDTGFAHAHDLVLRALEPHRPAAICLTHHHEDHTAAAAALARRHGCPIYLRHPEQRASEGVARLRFYRRLFWGVPEPFDPDDVPEEVRGRERRLRPASAPGHSRTHVVFVDPDARTVFTGDLIVAPGASAVMRQENPFALARSLRRVAALEPRRMLSGHGLFVDDPAPRLRAKAAAVEAAARRALELTDAGVADRRAARLVFPRGHVKALAMEALTGGEFSRVNFVRAARRHREEAPPGSG